jgi:dolichol-phosphate mannosyltransferase
MLTMLTMLTQWSLEPPQRPSGLDALRRSLQGIDWEAIFVDDDSQDGTSDAVCGLGNQDRRVRCIQRIGRRRLAAQTWRARGRYGILFTFPLIWIIQLTDHEHICQLTPVIFTAGQSFWRD